MVDLPNGLIIKRRQATMKENSVKFIA